jgi:DNA sulfur modification protein DndB
MPCLRGNFGNWIYYACLMSLEQLSERVHFAREIHKSEKLSELIQRSLEGERAKNIAQYLKGNDERFFNSLVLATYEGSPQWFDIGNLRSSKNSEILDEMSEGAVDTLGLLRLEGSEQIFALDGQHRLAGIKMALEHGFKDKEELVPIILVGHGLDAESSKRTRRLFTTLNKTAIPVNKKDIIALDEDDVMAITARRMVEEDAAFQDPKVAVVASESMPAGNQQALITISALYDVLKILFMHKDELRSDYSLRFNRPTDAALDAYYKYAVDYFQALGRTFTPIAEFLKSKKPADVVKRYRTAEGGHVLYRTVGLTVFTRTALAISAGESIPVDQAISRLAKLPTQLTEAPFSGTIWDPVRKAVRPGGRVIAQRVVFHMLKLGMSERQRASLEGDYRVTLGYERDDSRIKLPKPVV